jgi:hypothetical protein
MAEREIDLADLLRTVPHGRTCTVGSPPDWIGGAYLFEEMLVIAGAWSILSKGFEDLVLTYVDFRSHAVKLAWKFRGTARSDWQERVPLSKMHFNEIGCERLEFLTSTVT